MTEAAALTSPAATAIPPAERAPLPQVIYIELADYCNLSCMFCGREAEIKQTGDKGGYVDIEKVKKLDRPLRAAKYFGLSGRIGEPLLYPKLGELLEWVYGINPGIQLRITTNGTSLSRKIAGLLAGHIDFVGISLNASNAQAYARDMRPVGYHPGADWTRNWESFIRRITEFMRALPPEDRKKVFIIAPAHRDNVDDMPDFVRLVARIGCSRAVITPMQAHDEAKAAMSIFWLQDKYNDVMDEAALIGAKLGVRVEAARFYSTVKNDIDISTLCRDPLEIAYLNMEKQGKASPCCHWAEEKLPMDVYRDANGFERFWNQDVYRRLRIKRDFKSCKACGLARAFDEVMFHFTPLLKSKLIASGTITEAETQNVYLDHELVRACHSIGVNLPSLRRTLNRLGVPIEQLRKIQHEGIAALSSIDHACWAAFLESDPAAGPVDVELAGCFAGIGWGAPEYDPEGGIAWRWLANGRNASVFVRVEPGFPYEITFSAFHLPASAAASTLRVTACECPLKTSILWTHPGKADVTAILPAALSRAHAGRLWLTIGDSNGGSSAEKRAIAFPRLQLKKISSDPLQRLRNTKRQIVARTVQVRYVLNIVKADPRGAVPRILGRIARLLRLRH
jgi:MoaA/NifB/PqqE/SkfB family radical SAM enzyme